MTVIPECATCANDINPIIFRAKNRSFAIVSCMSTRERIYLVIFTHRFLSASRIDSSSRGLAKFRNHFKTYPRCDFNRTHKFLFQRTIVFFFLTIAHSVSTLSVLRPGPPINSVDWLEQRFFFSTIGKPKLLPEVVTKKYLFVILITFVSNLSYCWRLSIRRFCIFNFCLSRLFTFNFVFFFFTFFSLWFNILFWFSKCFFLFSVSTC